MSAAVPGRTVAQLTMNQAVNTLVACAELVPVLEILAKSATSSMEGKILAAMASYLADLRAGILADLAREQDPQPLRDAKRRLVEREYLKGGAQAE